MRQLIADRYRLCGLAAGGLLVTSLLAVAPPARALPVFTVADMHMTSDGYSSSLIPCTTAKSASPEQHDVPVAENGAPTSLSTSLSGTITNNGDATDFLAFATSAASTGRVTSAGDHPGVIELTSNANLETATSKPMSACSVTAYSGGYMDYGFTVAQGGFMTFTTRAGRHTYGEINLHTGLGDPFFDIAGNALKLSGTNRIYLPPGTYRGYFRADHYLISKSTAVPSTPSSISIRGSYDVAGSRTEAVSGKGRKYVTFAGARSCATDSVDALVTGKGKRARQIRRVKLFVNDAKVRSLATPKKGQLVRLPVSAEADADIRAEVTLKPARPGRKPKTYEVTVGYIACS